MPRGNPLQQYCLKMPKSTWEEVDKHRMTLVGITSAQGITRADYIRDAVTSYNQYQTEVVLPKVRKLKESIDEPVPFFIDNGLDVRW